ncbi:MAG: hypothetical protein J7K98_01900 [Candidatus Aenigmarchaeota archaeon]|nr:hypothetical protein [Candidatus Aenigmarchaeota archaeon]
MEFVQRYVPKKISEIDPENDTRVRVTGTVIDVTDDSIFIDDGTGTVRVSIQGNLPEFVKNGLLIRVFGIVYQTSEGFEILANIIQNLDGLDLNLFKKVKELYNRWGCEFDI